MRITKSTVDLVSEPAFVPRINGPKLVELYRSTGLAPLPSRSLLNTTGTRSVTQDQAETMQTLLRLCTHWEVKS